MMLYISRQNEENDVLDSDVEKDEVDRAVSSFAELVQAQYLSTGVSAEAFSQGGLANSLDEEFTQLLAGRR